MDLKSERPSFLIYKADYEAIKNLSDQNLGKLFRAIFEYHNDKELQLEPEVQMALNFLKKQLQLDHIKWEKKVAAQKANGEKGGRPKKSDGPDSKEKPNQTHGFPKNPTKPKKPEKEKGKEKEKVNKDINMENPRKIAKFGINSSESRKLLEEVWEGLKESWKQDSKIREMYENKLAEFEN